jgi:hypothetical protein
MLVARRKNVYFVPQESFDLSAMFQNPLIAIMVFGGVMVMVMPYIIVRIFIYTGAAVLLMCIPERRKIWTLKC